MPSLISHAAVAVAAGVAVAPRDVPSQFWALPILCSILPDADVIGLSFGIPYHHLFGHRGFLHSPFFGLVLSIFVVAIFFRPYGRFHIKVVFLPTLLFPVGSEPWNPGRIHEWGIRNRLIKPV